MDSVIFQFNLSVFQKEVVEITVNLLPFIFSEYLSDLKQDCTLYIFNV